MTRLCALALLLGSTAAAAQPVAATAAQPVAATAELAHARRATLADLEDAVRIEIAARWNVAPAHVALSWLAPPPVLPAAAAIRLDGGTGGMWVVTVLADHGRASAALRVRAGVIAPRHVAARPIARGTLLSLDDISTRDTVRWGGPVAAADIPEGWVARRTLSAGEPLLHPAVTPPDAVSAGATVQLVYETATLRVTSTATALGSAPLGGRIGIRLDSGRRVEAIVTAPGEVRLGTQRK